MEKWSFFGMEFITVLPIVMEEFIFPTVGFRKQSDLLQHLEISLHMM